MLSVNEYDEAERDASSRMPNKIIQAFKPVVFQEIGYPTRVNHDYELFRYIDVMHEFGFEREFRKLLGSLTEDEFDILGRITKKICSFSEKKFKMKSVAKSSAINSLNIVRHIRYLSGTARPRIFEIGAGCGYLGAMLAQEGYPYAATDVSQAFYLYQNHMWNHVTDGNVQEMVNKDEYHEGLYDLRAGSIVHIPWWGFLTPGKMPQFDIITCNHALCEMHPASLRFTLKIARSLLQEGGLKAFIFEGWGWDRNNSLESVTEVFYKNGFSITYLDKNITVLVPSGTANSLNSLELPKQIQNETYHMEDGGLVCDKEMVNSYQPIFHSASENPITMAIESGRQGDKRIVGIDQVNKFYTEILGSSYHLTSDEEFMNFIEYIY